MKTQGFPVKNAHAKAIVVENPGQPGIPHAQGARARAGGALVFACLLLSACGTGGSSGSGDSSRVIPPAGTQTQTLTLSHGRGFVCTVWQRHMVYCWASEAAAVANGDAAWMGLSGTIPQLIFTDLTNNINVIPSDRGIIVNPNNHLFGTQGQGTAFTYQEDEDCTVLAPAEVFCPGGNAVSDLTFSRNEFRSPTKTPYALWRAQPGEGLFFFGGRHTDPQLIHYPHSATWFAVRKAA